MLLSNKRLVVNLNIDVDFSDVFTVKVSIKKTGRNQKYRQGIVNIPKEIIDRHGVDDKDFVTFAFVKKTKERC